MTATPVKSKAADARGMLPARIKVLYITTLHRTGGWLAEAFAADMAADVVVTEAVGVTAGMAQLRDEVFDAVLISHEPGVLDSLSLVEALRAGGSEEPLVVLGSQSEQEMAPLCFEVDADAYCPDKTTTARGLLWTIARAMERHRLLRENRRLVQADRQRLEQEHHEAELLLAQQRALIHELEQLRDGTPQMHAADADAAAADAAVPTGESESPCDFADGERLPLPEKLIHYYREILRAYVIMGAGNLAGEMSRMADMLAMAGVTARQTVEMHVDVLEDLIGGLGNRSARHVMNRADLLILETIVHLAEGYRQRYFQRVCPPIQLTLPGFDVEAQRAA